MLVSHAALYLISWFAFSFSPDSRVANALSNVSKKRGALPQDKILKTLTYYKLDKALSQDLIDSAESDLKAGAINRQCFFLSQSKKQSLKLSRI